ncbi:MAG TPA: calcium-binding protein, partial [Rhodocyclaceae bacterium]
NVLIAGDGNARLHAGSGNTTMYGGAGSDTLIGGSGANVIYAGDGGTASRATEIYVGSDTTTVHGGEGIARIFLGNGRATVYGGSGSETITGGDVAYVQGGDGTELIQDLYGIAHAGKGEMTIAGSAGTYVEMDAGFGSVEVRAGAADRYGLVFGDGIDGSDDLAATVAFGSDGSLAVAVDEAGGGRLVIDNGFANLQQRLFFGVRGGYVTLETLLKHGQGEATDAQGNSFMLSSDPGSLMAAGAGNDTLVAFGAETTLAGGAGDDTYFVNSADQVVVEQAGQGNNTIVSSVSYVLPDNVQNLTLTGTQNLTATGNGLANVIVSNSGVDTLIGGAANATFVVNNAADVVRAQAGANTVISSVSFVAPEHVQTLQLTGTADLRATANDEGDTLVANGGNDTFVGGAGDDTFVLGAAGHYVISDKGGANVIRMAEGVTADSLVASVRQQMADGGWTLHLDFGSGGGSVDIVDGFENAIGEIRFADGTVLSLQQATAALPGMQLQAGNGDVTLVGTGGNDSLTGGAGNVVIHGGRGDDLIDGGNGNATLIGGEGADTYVLRFGMAMSTIVDDGGVLRLGQGVSTDDLQAERRGKDLVLTIAGTPSGLIVKDYADHAGSWSIELSGGERQPVDAIVGAPAAVTPEALARSFRTQMRAEYFAELAALGYVAQPDGSWVRTETYASWPDTTTTRAVARYQETVKSGDDAQLYAGSGEVVTLTGQSQSVGQVTIANTSLARTDGQSVAIGSAGRYVPFDSWGQPIAGFSYPFGATIVRVTDTSGHFTGCWVYPPNTAVPSDIALSGTQTRSAVNTVREYSHVYSTAILQGGSGDQYLSISERAIVVAGTGNDTLSGSGSCVGDGKFGSLFQGGLGNDEMIGTSGSDMLISGTAGHDVMDGRGGGDTYVLVDKSAQDLIVDTGDTGVIAPSVWKSGEVPTAAIQPDVIVFPVGVSAADLRFSWSDTDYLYTVPCPEWARYGIPVVPNFMQPFRDVQTAGALLSIEWGDSGGVQVMMPYADFPGAGIEQFRFADGTVLTREQLLAMAPPLDLGNQDHLIRGSGDLYGGDGDDTIIGGDGGNRIIAGGGDDLLVAGSGGDLIFGGLGADTMIGGAGYDTLGAGGETFFGAGKTYRAGTGGSRTLGSIDADLYELGLGSGNTTISDLYHGNLWGDYMDLAYGTADYWQHLGLPSDYRVYESAGRTYRGLDVIRFGDGVKPEDLRLFRYGDDLAICNENGTDSIRLEIWYGDRPRQIDRIEFADGAVWTGESLDGRVTVNGDPVAGRDIGTVTAVVGHAASLDIAAAGQIADPDGDRVSYRLSMAGGADLPSWLVFDSRTGRITGTPGEGDVGTLGLSLDVTDPFGGTVRLPLTLVVDAAPTVIVGLPNQVVTATASGQTLVAALNDTLVGAADGATTFEIGQGDGSVMVQPSGSGNSLRFGPGIGPQQITLGIGSLTLRLGYGGDEVQIGGFDPAQAESFSAIQNFAFADGTTLTYEQLVARGFDIHGGSGDDALTGTNLDNRISAGAGNDVLVGSGAHDTLDGGVGNDTLIGGSGHETFVFNPGDGRDEIVDGAKNDPDAIEFGPGVSAANVSLTQSGRDLDIAYGTRGDHVLVRNFDPAGDGRLVIDRLKYADGSYSTYANDGRGDAMRTDYRADGTKQADVWSRADGSHGSDAFNPDGSSSGKAYRSDGSYVGYVDDGQGDVTRTNYSRAGIRLTDSWTHADGSSGSDVYNPDGSYASHVDGADGSVANGWHNADGSYVEQTVEADGSIENAWHGADGSYAIQFNGADGARAKIWHGADGSYSEQRTGADGSVAERWGNANGSGGSRFVNADGSGESTWRNPDGSCGSQEFGVGGAWIGDSWCLPNGNQMVNAGNGHLIEVGTSGSAWARAGKDILIGKNATIGFAWGTDILAFDKGDGRDTVYAYGGGKNVISLGGNFDYADLSFHKNGNDLVLDVGTADSITLKDWYTFAGNRNVATLQVIAEATAAYASGASPLSDHKIETFDFQQLVARFDQARAAIPGLNAWHLSNALLDAHLSGSDTAALGGDLAYEYGLHGDLAGMSVAAAQSNLSDANFAIAPQTLHPWSQVSGGAAQLK